MECQEVPVSKVPWMPGQVRERSGIVDRFGRAALLGVLRGGVRRWPLPRQQARIRVETPPETDADLLGSRRDVLNDLGSQNLK